MADTNTNMGTFIENIDVPDSFLDKVKVALGYPVVDKDVISDIFSDDYIKNDICAICLETFYTYFPLIKSLDINVNGQTSTVVDAPENAMGIVHYAFVDKSSTNASNTILSGLNLNSQVGFFGTSRANYGTPFNFDSYEYSPYQKKFFTKAIENDNKMYFASFNEIENKIMAKSSTSGIIHCDIGCYDEKIENIPKRLRVKYLDLCKAELKIQFGSALKYMNSDLPLSIDASELFDNGTEEKEKLIEWFEFNSSYSIMR